MTDRPKRHVPHLAIERAAGAAVRPFAKKLGTWQADAIRLETISRRLRDGGRSDPGVLKAVETLIATVAEQRAAFDAAAAALSEDVAQSNRVGDTRQAFEMVVARLTATKALLGGG